MSDERGQASVEWIGLLLLVSVALAAALAFLPAVDGRPLGASIAHALVCAVKRDCAAERVALRHAYGDRDAQLVRANAPNLVYEPGTFTLPVDYRRCRSHRCADAPDDRDLDVTRATRGGAPATAFTHVVHHGGSTYIQYWFYYPDSPSTFAHSWGIQKTLHIRKLPRPKHWLEPWRGWKLESPFHPDDWEGYQVRVDADGSRWVRATAHGHYQWCKHIWCKNEWGPSTGWTRISRGSHAGHIPLKATPHLKQWGIHIAYEPLRPGAGLHERSTTAPGIELVPLETLDHHTYKPQKGGIDPPWTKPVYVNPASDSS